MTQVSVHQELPLEGATPGEIKYPFSKRNDTAIQAALDRYIHLEDRKESSSIKVDHNSGYYCTAQGHLATTGLTWYDFCVCSSNWNEWLWKGYIGIKVIGENIYIHTGLPRLLYVNLFRTLGQIH